MSMPYGKNLSKLLGNLGVLPNSTPTAVDFRGKLYVFYMGVGNDGVFYTTASANDNWSSIVAMNNLVQNLSVAPGTSPAAVAFKGNLYLFYNGSGNDGVFCTVFDNNNWSPVFSVGQRIGGMGFLPETSPHAAVFQQKLYLFWNGSGDNGMFYCSYDNTTWKGQERVPNGALAPGTSPFAVVNDTNTLYLFWNGRGNDGAWWATFNGNSWSGQHSLARATGGMGFLPKTSPSALRLMDGKLRVFWVGNGGNSQGLWFADRETTGRWNGQLNMKEVFGPQELGSNTSSSPVIFSWVGSDGSSGHTPYVFWKGNSLDLFYARGN